MYYIHTCFLKMILMRGKRGGGRKEDGEEGEGEGKKEKGRTREDLYSGLGWVMRTAYFTALVLSAL